MFKNKKKIITVTSTCRVQEATAIMKDNDIGALPVVGPKNELLGIFTERDVTTRVVSLGKDAKNTEISDVMTKNPKCAKESESRASVFKMMKQNNFRHVPIIGDQGNLVDIVSLTDIDVRSEKIIIIEPDRLVIETLQGYLKNQTFQIYIAQDVATAKDMIENSPEGFLAILLALETPEKNSIELLTWLQLQKVIFNSPVIIFTDNSDKSLIRESINKGPFYYLTKPMSDENTFLTTLNLALQDFHVRNKYFNRFHHSENPLQYLREGTFHFQTLEEGEYLTSKIANASGRPKDTILVDELFENAVEHGNLGITYGEKTLLVKDGIWNDEVKNRLLLKKNKNKFVEVILCRDDDNMILIIKDQGQGFDYKKYLNFDADRVFHNHGRGIALTNSQINIEFIPPGNQVRVTIPDLPLLFVPPA